MSFALFRLRSHPNRSPARNTLSVVFTSLISIHIIHPMGVRFTLFFRVSPLNEVSHSSPLLFTTCSPSEIVSVSLIIRHGAFSLCVRFAGVFVTSIFAGAFAFGVGFDIGVTNLWDSWNRGVRWTFLCSFQQCTHTFIRNNGRIFGRNISRKATRNKTLNATQTSKL